MTTAADIAPNRAEAIRQHLRAIDALLNSLGGGEVEVVEEAWPPDPMTINLHDGTWLLAKAAKDVAGCSIDTIYRRIAAENIAVKIGGVWWVNRARLLSGRSYPKRSA